MHADDGTELLLLKALRRQGDEAQLTQLLDAVARDGDVSWQLATLLIDAAPNPIWRRIGDYSIFGQP